MKIAIVTKGGLPLPNVLGGGAETLITALLDENEKANNYIKIFSIANEKAEQEAIKYKNTDFVFMRKQNRSFGDRIRGRLLAEFPRTSPYSFEDASKIIEKEEFDKIVVENTPWQFPYMVKKFGSKVYLHLHNDWVNGDTKGKYRERYVEAINNSGGVIAISKYMKERIMTVGNVLSQKISVLYNATDVDRFKTRPIKSDIDKLRRRLGIELEDLVVLYGGRICEEKGVLELVKAFDKITQKYKHIKLLIVGSVSYGETTSDEYTLRVGKIVKSNRNIIETGFVSYKDMPNYYQIADFQVIPSKWDEPFGLVAIEGAASGLPIISTDSGGLKEIFEGKYAYTISREKLEEDLYKSIELLINDASLRKNYVKKSKELIESKKYDYENYYREFLRILSDYDKN